MILLDVLFPDNWAKFVTPDYPMFEIFLRGTIVYLFVFFALRFVLRRETAGVGISDLLVIVLIADAVQNGMAGTYTSVPDSLVLAATIIGWAWALDYIAFRFPRVRTLIHPQAMKLIDNGRILGTNARKEMLTREEILAQLRLQGIDEIEDVKEAWIEGSGMITAIPKHEESTGDEKKQRQAG